MTPKRIDHSERKFLNVGCGAHFHPDWCNIDLVSSSKQVMQHDIRQGLPFDDATFQAVYHSHVLEHLTPQQGELLIRECQRVLRPAGVLRIVVPDLEQIARIYLQMLQKAWVGDPVAEKNYEWMKLELLDQMVRHQSGGMMGPYMIDSSKSNADFVRSRIGAELDSCQRHDTENPRPKSTGWFGKTRLRVGRRIAELLLGAENSDALREGLFRQQGEIHRWMYDRLSLKNLCEQCGMVDFRVCSADESSISAFASFELDSRRSLVRKPDSLFVEARKRSVAAKRAA